MPRTASGSTPLIAQGVLLDEWRGFHPYTTCSTTTFANAEALLAEAGQTPVRLGVVRAYMTRHGRRLDRLRPGPERDLGYQERLTGMLLRVRLGYEDPAVSWPEVIEGVLGAPVAIVSAGPAAAGKHAAPWLHNDFRASLRARAGQAATARRASLSRAGGTGRGSMIG